MASSTAWFRTPSSKLGLGTFFLSMACSRSYTVWVNVCSHPMMCPGGHHAWMYGCSRSVTRMRRKPCSARASSRKKTSSSFSRSRSKARLPSLPLISKRFQLRRPGAMRLASTEPRAPFANRTSAIAASSTVTAPVFFGLPTQRPPLDEGLERPRHLGDLADQEPREVDRVGGQVPEGAGAGEVLLQPPHAAGTSGRRSSPAGRSRGSGGSGPAGRRRRAAGRAAPRARAGSCGRSCGRRRPSSPRPASPSPPPACWPAASRRRPPCPRARRRWRSRRGCPRAC